MIKYIKRSIIFVLIFILILGINNSYAKTLTKNFSFSYALKCNTMLYPKEGGTIKVKINSKKTTWLELEKKTFEVDLYQYRPGADKLLRYDTAKCEGITNIEWKHLPSGTYYLKFSKVKDGQKLEGTVTYTY